MSRFFTEYRDAARWARAEATILRNDVAIRRVTEYGKRGYAVSYASRNDSDYTTAEIIRPGE